MIKGLEWLLCKELLSETGLFSLEKSWDKRDAEETINVREKVVEMTYSLLPNTRMMGHDRKEPGSGHTKGDFPLGNIEMTRGTPR